MKKITLKQAVPFSLLALVAVIAIFAPNLPSYTDDGKYNAADIAWIIVATALVFFDDARSCLFLWRYGASEKRDFHNDQKCSGCRRGQCSVDCGRL